MDDYLSHHPEWHVPGRMRGIEQKSLGDPYEEHRKEWRICKRVLRRGQRSRRKNQKWEKKVKGRAYIKKN